MLPEAASGRLALRFFTPGDADEAFGCITPTLARWMSWEPPVSRAAFAEVWQAWLPTIRDGTDLHFVVRSVPDGHFVGLVGLHRARTASPELGAWIREECHGRGFGSEAVDAVVAWASMQPALDHFVYPVAEENTRSRRLAERLGGQVVERRSIAKFETVVYRIPRAAGITRNHACARREDGDNVPLWRGDIPV